MSPADGALIAMAALLAHPMRSLLTMLGIIIGVAAVIAMVAVGTGARVRIAEQIGTLGSNLLMVQPGGNNEAGAHPAGNLRNTLSESDAAAIGDQIGSVIVAAPSIRGTGRLIDGNRNWNTVINGTRPGYFIAREWRFKSGRPFSEYEVQTAAKVVTLGASAARALFGENNPEGETIRIEGVPFRIVGVLAEKGPDGSGRD